MLGVRCWLLDVLVAASPRCAVSQSCTLRGVGKFRCVGPSDALPNTIRRYSRLKTSATAASPQQAKQIPARCAVRAAFSDASTRLDRLAEERVPPAARGRGR